MHSDPREIMNRSEMSFFQIIVIAIMIGLNSLDGFDILSITFASPGIAKEWGIDKLALGIVLSMELIGMGIGSFFLGGIADKLGRRPTVLSCLIIMASGMFMVTTSANIIVLSFWRIITGIGIGGMLAAINALTAEFSNLKRRHLCVSLMSIGYPLGGIVGGMIASRLLANYDWRTVFYLGASVTACFLPIFYFFVPESVHWLAREQPGGALIRINGIFKRFGFSVISALPQLSHDSRKKSGLDIFKPWLIRATMILSATYFLHVLTYYLILKWTTKIVVDMGFTPSSAGHVLVWANTGGAIGGLIFGLLTMKFDLKKLAVGILFFAAVTITIFGHSPTDLTILSALCMLAGVFGNAGIIALYAVVAHAYPTHARASGTGFILAIGRGGAALSPILVGWLRQENMSLPAICMIMSVGSFVAAIVLLFLNLESGDASEALRSQGKEGVVPSGAQERISL